MAAAAELWRFQAGCDVVDCYDYAYAAAVATDLSSFIAGGTWGEWNGTASAGMADFLVAKVDSIGSLEWSWQDGSGGSDYIIATAAVSDGGVVAAGYTNGTSWNDVSGLGGADFAAVKLHSNGSVAWTWQDGTTSDDMIRTCSETPDGNVVVGGYTQGSWADITNGYNDIAAAKIDVNNGATLWEFQAGTADDGGAYAYGASARPDGSVVLGGRTFGEFDNALSGPAGSTDFIAVAVDEDGAELWRWQDGPGSGFNTITCITALDDNSVILAGHTQGDWGGEGNLGGYDFAVVKLSSLGVEEWRWQGGTAEEDQFDDAATGTDGSVILSGYTKGSWAATYAGGDWDDAGDFVALALDANGTLLWTYQAGTEFDDAFRAVAVREDGAILLAGWTNGVWSETAEFDGFTHFAAVLLDTDVLLDTGTVFTTPAPGTVATTTQPTASATPEPQGSPVSTTPGPQGSPVAEAPVTEAPVPTEPTNTSSSSGISLGPIIGGVVGGAALLLLLGVLLTRRHRQPTARKTIGTSVARSGGFPQSTSTAAGGGAATARVYRQSAAPVAGVGHVNRQSASPAAGVNHAYRQPAVPPAGAGYADPPPPSYFEVVPRGW